MIFSCAWIGKAEKVLSETRFFPTGTGHGGDKTTLFIEYLQSGKTCHNQDKKTVPVRGTVVILDFYALKIKVDYGNFTDKMVYYVEQ